MDVGAWRTKLRCGSKDGRSRGQRPVEGSKRELIEKILGFVWGRVFKFRNRMLDGSYKTFVILKIELKCQDPNVVWLLSDWFFAK